MSDLCISFDRFLPNPVGAIFDLSGAAPLTVLGLALGACLGVILVGAMLARNAVSDVKAMLETLPTLPAPSDTDGNPTRERFRADALKEFKDLVGWRLAPGLRTMGVGMGLLALVLSSGATSPGHLGGQGGPRIGVDSKIEGPCRTVMSVMSAITASTPSSAP